jgi:hypothetical protein
MGQKIFPKQKNLKKILAVVFTTMIFSNFRKTRIESYRIFFKNTEKETANKTVELISNKIKK